MYSKPFLAQAADPAVLRYCDCRNLQFPAMPAVLRSCGPCWLQFLQSLQLIRSGSLGHTRSSNRKVSDAGIIPKHELCERERERERARERERETERGLRYSCRSQPFIAQGSLGSPY